MMKNLSVFTFLLFCLGIMLPCQVAWALKNVCPACKKVLAELDRVDCQFCGKTINKCIKCGRKNLIKADFCAKCNANLAESRVLKSIDKKTRNDLQLGQSPRAQLETEIGQVEETIKQNGLTPETAARRVEILTQMEWWSKADAAGAEFAAQFPQDSHTKKVNACRVKALRNLAFMSLEGNTAHSIELLTTALSIDPQDKDSLALMEQAKGGSKKAIEPAKTKKPAKNKAGRIK